MCCLEVLLPSSVSGKVFPAQILGKAHLQVLVQVPVKPWVIPQLLAGYCRSACVLNDLKQTSKTQKNPQKAKKKKVLAFKTLSIQKCFYLA